MNERIYFDASGHSQDDPWEILQIQRGKDAEAITKRYRELIKEHPPEHQPETFQKINAAYRRLTHPDSILEREFFEIELFDPLDFGANSPDQSNNEDPADIIAKELLLYSLFHLFSDPEFEEKD